MGEAGERDQSEEALIRAHGDAFGCADEAERIARALARRDDAIADIGSIP